MKTTRYFDHVPQRPDRAKIRGKRIEHGRGGPENEAINADGRIRRWARIEAMEGRWLRVVLLPDGETVHNTFFDRRFRP